MSTTRLFNGLLLLSTIVALTGCSGLGGFGRKDYASLAADPFLDNDSEYDSARRSTDNSTSGFARLNDSRGTADTAVASIVNTRSSGPSLSDFMGQSPENASTSRGLVTAAAAADTVTTTHGQISDAASTADDDFLEWANAQDNAVRQASAQVQGNVRDTVQTADNHIRHAAAEVHSSISEFPNSVADAQKAADSFFDRQTAEPLIQERVRDPAAARSRISNEDPFAEFERQDPLTRKRTYPTATLKTAAARPTSQRQTRENKSKERFPESSGWRPSNFEYP